MEGYFTSEALDQLHQEHAELPKRCSALRERYVLHKFTTERGTESAQHGLCRRLGMLLRSIDIVFDVLPPELEEIPEKDRVDDATIAIHSFIMNTYGCLDNLAWIWVSEKNIKHENGTQLKPKQVGLGKEYAQVRKGLPKPFHDYLVGLEPWFEHLKGFRDSLAHRIPLYIPPFIVNSDHAEKYATLDRAWMEALSKGEFDRCDEIEREQSGYTFFRPWMTHSHLEDAPKVVFHSQLLIDFATVSEIATRSLDELTK